MDDRLIEAVSETFGCSYDSAEKFLSDECGAYAFIGDNLHWISGSVFRKIAEAALEK